MDIKKDRIGVLTWGADLFGFRLPHRNFKKYSKVILTKSNICSILAIVEYFIRKKPMDEDSADHRLINTENT